MASVSGPSDKEGNRATVTKGEVYATVPAKLIGVRLLKIIAKDRNIDRERYLR